MGKGFCAKCGKYAFLIDKSGKFCRDCQPVDLQKSVPVEESYNLMARNKGSSQDVFNSLFYLMQQKVPAMYVSTMIASSRGFGTLVPDNMRWATPVVEVLTDNFLCVVPDVFSGLVIFEGDAMVFTPPCQSTHNKHVPSPSISIMSLPVWSERLGCGGLKDWTCVLCHELIHYLHWRWTILPCDPKYNDEYEDQVSGQLLLKTCSIPGFKVKEENGLKELLNPPNPFTENGFRKKYGLKERKSYSDLSEFEKKHIK